MTNLSLFVSSLLSYLLVFGVFVLVIVNDVVLGVLFRKLVDKSKAKETAEEVSE